MSKESYIERKSVEYAFKAYDAISLKLTGQKGLPDRQFLYKGHSLFVEFKKPEGVGNDLQAWWCKRLSDEGFDAVSRVDTIVAFKQLFDVWVVHVNETCRQTNKAVHKR